MPAFRILNGDEYSDHEMVMHTLARAIKQAPSHRLWEVLHKIIQDPDIDAIKTYMVRYRLYDLWETEDLSPQLVLQSIIDEAERLAWLLRLIWAGLLHSNPDQYGRFGDLARAALNRLPTEASNDQARTVLNQWLAEAQPDAIRQCRHDCAIWLEEYLCEPGKSRALTDTDPNQVLDDLQNERPTPWTPQLDKLLSTFLFDWYDTQTDAPYGYGAVTISAVHACLKSQLTSGSAA